MTCNHPEPELCQRLGRHLFGRLYERYKNEPAVRDALEGKPAKPLPPRTTLAINYLKATARDIAHGFNRSSDGVVSSRLAICEACVEHFRPEDRRCSHPACGCFVDEKVRRPHEACPIDKWRAVAPSGKVPGCGSCGQAKTASSRALPDKT